MNELITKEDIKYMIYEIRGIKVILDSDIAMLFGYDTKNLNRQVMRNQNRFPNNYCFQLTGDEYKSLRCQNVTLKRGRGEHRKYMPYVFTEYGVTMLAGILKSDIAVEASIKIVNAFIEMKKYISEELIEQKYYKNMLLKHDEEIKKINDTLKKLETKELKEKIFFEGQVYDAYSKLLDIMNETKKELLIVDGYADKIVLDIISKLNKKIILITKKNSLLKEIDIIKYNEQYNNLKIIYNDDFHDRFLILDKKTFYHLGTSLNHAGKKIFGVNKMEDEEVKEAVINKIKNLI